jgi:hypothetical protein
VVSEQVVIIPRTLNGELLSISKEELRNFEPEVEQVDLMPKPIASLIWSRLTKCHIKD